MWCEWSVTITLKLSGYFTSFWVYGRLLQAALYSIAPAASAPQPNVSILAKQPAHYGSFSTFDVNSLRLRGKHATPRRRMQDYPRVNLTMRSPNLMETNDDKKPLRCQDSRSHVICLCHQSRAPFFSAFYLCSEALDEKRRARSTQSHKISASRPNKQSVDLLHVFKWCGRWFRHHRMTFRGLVCCTKKPWTTITYLLDFESRKEMFIIRM